MKKLLAAAGLTLLLAACNTQAPVTDNDSSAPAAKRAAMEWTSEQTGTGEYDMPITTITLMVPSTGDVIYTTTCNGTASFEGEVIEGSVASIQCWWAGGGDQYAVFVGEAEELTVRHRTVDEEAGFGEWEDVQ